jgi:hypothetical protein
MQDLVLGCDDSASDDLDEFDMALPPTPPMHLPLVAYIDHSPLQLQRSIRRGAEEASWKVVVAADESVSLSWDGSSASIYYTLVATAGGDEYDLGRMDSLDLPSGEHEIVIRLVQRHLLPTETKLLANYPNPFNPETWIPYQLRSGGDVTIRIYSVGGELIRTLPLGMRRPGYYVTRDKAAHWDGRNDIGEDVSSGVYFYVLQSTNFTATRKLLILK